MAEKRRRYDAEFREGAVRLVVETGKPVAEVAGGLGINEGTLHSWIGRAKKAGGDGSLAESKREELARLRRQDAEKSKRIEELEMERDAFKRSMASG
ncbi:transposase [Streptomyces sioyaensis]|uniref:transposase n=1 Tax=Streptomyces sioyaensis TaxID=67364 RepID=UPI0036E17FCA